MELDKNGYAPSIVQTRDTCCFRCGYEGDVARHEVFYGEGRREKSKRLGLWVHLCPRCHQYGKHAVHSDRQADLALKQVAQAEAMSAYGWSTEKFIEEFGMNYL